MGGSPGREGKGIVWAQTAVAEFFILYRSKI